MTTGYVFLREDRIVASGSQVTLTPPPDATHYESKAYSGGGAGGSVPATTGDMVLGAAASGGGAPGLSENKLRAIVTPIVIYAGKGGQPTNSIGLAGEDSWIKENGTIVLMAQGGEGGNYAPASPLFGDPSDPQGVLHNAGNSVEGGGGGNHDHFVGDYTHTGESGHPGLLLGNIRVMGGGGSSVIGAGGKASTTAGPGHGHGGGAMAFVNPEAFQGAEGQDGEIIIRWYALISF